MTNSAYRKYRSENNERVAKSKRAAKLSRAKRGWIITHPDLDDEQRTLVRRFLNGESVTIPEDARDLLRKHLLAARGMAREHYNALLAALDKQEEDGR